MNSKLYNIKRKTGPAMPWVYLQPYNPTAMNHTWGLKETAAKIRGDDIPKEFLNEIYDLEACPEGEEPVGRRTATEVRNTLGIDKPEIDCGGAPAGGRTFFGKGIPEMIDADGGIQRFIRRDGITTTPGTPITSRETILREAIELICKEREEDYGPPDDSFATIAKLWSTYLEAKCKQKSAEGGHEGKILFYFLTPKDVAILNILQKVSRLVTSPDKRDGWVNIAGYAGLGGGMGGQ